MQVVEKSRRVGPRLLAQRLPRGRVTVAMLMVAGMAAFAWWHWQAAPTGSAPSAVSAPVSGVVVTLGWLKQPGAHPIPSVRLLVTGSTTSDTRLTRHLTADGQGHFALRLPPGNYTMTALLSQALPTRFEPHTWFIVRRGQPQHIRIVQPVA
jgi:hypothetical protein